MTDQPMINRGPQPLAAAQIKVILPSSPWDSIRILVGDGGPELPGVLSIQEIKSTLGSTRYLIEVDASAVDVVNPSGLFEGP